MISPLLPVHRLPSAEVPPLRAALSAPPAWVTAVGMVLASLLIRLPDFGNPAIQVDEQFYLLVGDRMLHGSLPYIDIWDRKPIGLFLIYAAIRLLGGVGILQYQFIAALFAAGTAWIISRISRQAAGEWPAIASGLAYLVWIETVDGDGGQAPVFYNALVAGAALLILAAMARTDWRGFRNRAIGAMTLIGMAIQIKYTVAIEGVFFGLVLSWQVIDRTRHPPAFMLIATLASVGLLPTLLAFAAFARLGAVQAFLFANFTSIGLRDAPPFAGKRLWLDLQHVLPLAACCAASWWQLRKTENAEVRRFRLFLLGWLIAAGLGFGSVGAFYYHYLLPVFVPLAIGAAPIFARMPIGPVLAGLTLWLPLHAARWPDDSERQQARATVAAILSHLPPGLDKGCLQMFDGPPIIYHLTNACLVSRWPFPGHLMAADEAKAIGVVPAFETRRLMTAKPLAVIVGPMSNDPSPAIAAVRSALARSYHLSGTAVYEERTLSIYVRR